ncbi:MAG: hypothetical protein M1423_10645, partial [Acidobacteria bacterium]|nr:hypothetical protein [Acidobacteriota bacterium]
MVIASGAYLLLAAFHRIASPGPKTEAGDWYRQNILYPLRDFEPERFSSQAFGDCFEQLLPEKEAATRQKERDPLEEAQRRSLLGIGTATEYGAWLEVLVGIGLRHWACRRRLPLHGRSAEHWSCRRPS